MKIAFIFFVLWIYCLVPGVVYCGEITGTIIDQNNGSPIPGAYIKIEYVDTSYAIINAISDITGYYSITDVDSGEFLIKFSCIGYKSLEFDTTMVSSEQIMVIDVNLVENPVNLEMVLVTASRRPEKILEAPASVSILDSKNIEQQITLISSDHLKGLPAVDAVSTGMNQSSIVIRGFNNVFSGALLVLTDNRIARVPSLRYNAYSFIPTVNDDIDRIEIVSGPGSALYGPNSASGIMHILTKSTLKDSIFKINLGFGERNLGMGSFYVSNNYRNKFGLKVSGQYYRGDDWESFDPYEPDSIRIFKATPEGPEYSGGKIANNRNYEIEKMSVNTRVDLAFNRDLLVILSGGLNRSNSIELTALGAGQAIDWTYSFAQARLVYKDLFGQIYINASDAGDTYLLRTGQLIIDKSRVISAQIQHKYHLNDYLNIIYGSDTFFTRPRTESSINGRNENSDSINEIGGYVQTELKISEKLKLIGAGRLDKHNKIKNMIFSPRAAVTYRQGDVGNFRLTYNRAYSTPNSTNLFLDVLQADDPFGIGGMLEPYAGFSPDIDFRVQGVPETGFHWNFNENGPQFSSPLAPLDPLGRNVFDFNDPVFTNVMWSAGREIVLNGYSSILLNFGVPQMMVDSLLQSLEVIVPNSIIDVNNILRVYNPNTSSFDDISFGDIADIDPLKPTYTQTVEFGYKGALAENLIFGADLYYTRKNNFIGPLAIETPNVFLDPETLYSFLDGELETLLSNPENANHAIVLSDLDDPSFGGNGNGTPIDEMTNLFTYGASQVPFGTVSPVEAYDPNAVLVTVRNFGDVSLYGADFAVKYSFNELLSFTANYSYISKNFFEKSENQVHDIYLNAPKHKFSLSADYLNQKYDLSLSTLLRFVDSFDMYGPFVGTRIDRYVVIDANLRKKIVNNLYMNITCQNLLNNKHIEFIGAPELGRLTILRLSYSI
jgi:iron complex outermembrane receptor protein